MGSWATGARLRRRTGHLASAVVTLLVLAGAVFTPPATAQGAGPAAAPAVPSKARVQAPFEPCAEVAGLVSGAFRGRSPDGLVASPLYLLDLEVEPARLRLSGTFQVVFAAPEGGLRDVTLIFPAPREPDGSLPVQAGLVQVAVGEDPLHPALADRDDLVLTVPLRRPARPGERVVVQVGLDGLLPRFTGGTYDEGVVAYLPGAESGTVGAFASDEVGATLLGAHPVLAPRNGGAWSRVPPARWGAPVPSAPACILANVTAPAGLIAAATGLQVGEVPEPDGRIKRSFVSAGTRRFAVVLRPEGLTRIERQIDGVTLRVTARDEAAAKKAARWATEALRTNEARYGRYPWKRLELVEAPVNGLLGGLHGPGLVVINDLLSTPLDPMSVALVQQDDIQSLSELTVVHQIAHQWFGELVAVGGPLSPALEEALAQDASLAYARRRYGARSARSLRNRAVYGTYQLWRALGSPDAAADRPAAEVGLAGWTALCQGKAPGLLQALGELLGPKSLQQGLRRYVDANRYGEGGRAVLRAELVRAHPQKRKAIEAAFARWLDEAHGDEDLGDPSGDVGNLGGLMGLGSGSGSMGLSPQDAAAMKQMMEMLQGMMQAP